MLKNFTLLLFSCVLISSLNSCKKDTAINANAGGTSLYSFDGAPSGCAAPVIAGIYSVGMPLSASNTASFSVNVSVKGSYSITTTSANGVSFSGSGIFANEGPQTVVLKGTGTPVRTGNFSFVPATNNTCNFSVSFSAGGPSATFTYAGAPGNCTAPIVSGTYASGISLGASNYVDLAVNVTNPGTYTINTNNINGMSFSGTGVFTTTGGGQVVRLTGNGTPAAAGSFTFTPGNNGCSFSIAVVPPLPPATFTYNGAPGNCTTPAINGTYAASTALNGTNTIVLSVNVSVVGSYSVSTNSSNGVVFSASGNFTALGGSTITLTSNNTPSAPGTFTYTPAGGCSFDITYTGAPPPADFLKCTINGTLINFSDNMLGASDQTSSPYTFHVDGDLTGGTDNFAIDLTNTNNPIVAGNFNNFSLGNQSKFCSITYSTGTGFPWGSSLLNANSFVVNLTSITATKATGTFSGTVYDNLGTGTNTKSITAGSFSVTY